jgi:hypothetical protein
MSSSASNKAYDTLGQSDMPQRHDHPGGCRQTQGGAWRNLHRGKDPSLHSGTEVRPSGKYNPQEQLHACHQQCHLDPHGTHQPRSIICRCPQCRQRGSHMQTVQGAAQNQAKELRGLPERQRGREGTHPLCRWRQLICPPQEAIYWFRQHDCTSND